MNPIKVDLLNPRTAAYECRECRHIIPMNKEEYAGWQVLIKIDHAVCNIVDVMVWGSVISKVERMHGI